MTDPSFYYAIYKRLQATASSHGAHINGDNDPPDQTYGGFSLKYADATYGIFKQLGPQASFWGYTPGMKPLKDKDTTPANNPMWAILNASLLPNPPDKITSTARTGRSCRRRCRARPSPRPIPSGSSSIRWAACA